MAWCGATLNIVVHNILKFNENFIFISYYNYYYFNIIIVKTT